GRPVLADPQAGERRHGDPALFLGGRGAAEQRRPHPRLQRRQRHARTRRRGAHPSQSLRSRLPGRLMLDAVSQPAKRPGTFGRIFERYPFLPVLIIFVVLLALNGLYQPRSVSLVGITGLAKTYLALILLAVAQTYVVYAGDIDLSAGAIVSLVNVVIVSLMAY